MEYNLLSYNNKIDYFIQNKFGKLIYFYYIRIKKTNMKIKSFSDKVLLTKKRDVLKYHLYLKFLQNNIKSSENDIDIIIELFLFGGYNNSEQQSRFINLCIEKNYKKTDQSVRNTLSKYTNIGIFEKPKNTILKVSNTFIPSTDFDKLIINHIVSHAE